IDAEQPGDEFIHAALDLPEEIAGGGVERVVEVEDPAVDVAQGKALPDTRRSNPLPLAGEGRVRVARVRRTISRVSHVANALTPTLSRKRERELIIRRRLELHRVA